MGPIGTVKRSFLPVGYSRGSVKMQLNNIKRVGSDKESLTGLLTVKQGNNQVSETATAKWSSSDGGFKVKSSGVSTIIDGEDSISVVFDMSDLSLNKTMKLNLNNNVDLSSSTSTTTSSDRTVTALSNYNDLTTVMSDVEDIKTELAFPQEDYILDAQMSDIPDDGVLDKLLIFRKYALDLQDMTITKKPNTLGAIMVFGKHNSNYGNFIDFASVTGSIVPPTTAVTHTMNNVKLVGLGNNTDDKDINALTLVNVSNTSTFTNIQVIDAQDDGIEIFGGNVNMTNVLVDSAADDYFDTDHGHSGTITNLKLFQTTKWLGKSLIECGNSSGTTTTKFENVTFNDGYDASSYQNNGSDKNFNIKDGSEVTINGVLLIEPQDELPPDYILDASMSDIPDDGVLDKLLIFRNNPLTLENMTITKKPNTLGAIMVFGKHNSNYGNFIDFASVTGSIVPPTTAVTHTMNNVKLVGLGNNTDDKDINALTLVNVSNTSTFTNIQVIDAQDDGIEIFGGNVNMTNVLVDSAADDYFDTDHGHSGTITNLKLFQTTKWLGKSLIECGNSSGTTTTKFENVTFNDGYDASSYQNNGSDKNFNIKDGSEVTINGVLLIEPQDELP